MPELYTRADVDQVYASNRRSDTEYGEGYDDQSSASESSYGPTRLFDIIEEGMPHANENRPLTALEANQRKELIEQTWDKIRKWLWSHQEPSDRAQAVKTRGNNEATPLHSVCKLSNPPTDIVQALLEASVEPAMWTDSHGWLPLHHACANGACGEVLQILADAYPEGKTLQDTHQRTPLHFYLTQRTDNSSAMAANMPFLCDSGAPELADIGGMLPMHYACAYGVSAQVLAVLEESYPDALVARENKGRTPLHLAMVNAHRDASPGVIQFLLQNAGKELVNVRDLEGYLPLHLLALGLRGFKAEEPQQRTNVSECLRMYLAAEPTVTADFLTALQDLPDWLQDVAVISQHVRNILNEKIVQRLPTFLLIFDLIMYVMLILVFYLTSQSYIRYGRIPEEDSRVNLYFLVFGATWFFLRELVQIISLCLLGSVSSWFYDPWNWLDVTVIVLMYYFSITMFMSDGGMSDDLTEIDDKAKVFRDIAAATQFILWMAILSFLKTTLVDFAIFVGGVIYVINKLVAFFIAVVVFMFMFAQMFYFIYMKTDTCKDCYERCGDGLNCDNPFPHCDYIDSLVKVFTMMMGEIGNEARYGNNISAQVVYVAYAIIVVILLSNVLIAIVTESYEVIQNDRAAVVFWGNRLDFVTEVDAISYGLKRRLKVLGGNPDGTVGASSHVMESAEYAEDKNNLNNRVKTMPACDKVLYKIWKSLVQLFDQNLYDDIASPQNIEFWCYVLFQGVAVLIIIPLWIIIGLVTCGILWPPQIREFLFVSKETTISRADIENKKLERLKDIQGDLKSLATDMRKEMEADRDELLRMKSEVDVTQNDVMADLQQVRELMTTLLDMGRQRT
mmetsp:Transcript_14770/g.21787  ORF Transcript_14770/g.21787 Transcript_14770/m.21787 type:complete len:848 (+) Transcript_14770:220-2763(+)|eukprot:CAMPEP_0194213162 /NCGR_PEP_ID=MMETSP0156-20130528/13552_1 /TAXON_ID=33649 /ORGANISM="Thalassionema nitzschioides, Strain L26-B" /LENGTH=847 /DNA_ID=CAMNT_0038941133 /DNA_START=111 /DNA_END=2654 /DNA_ORIENTATION=-